jgi:hypothetical protein
MELVVRNVNHAFAEIFWKLKILDLKVEDTRNGPAYVFPDLVVTKYMCPNERVLFHAGRDANPIFHLMESIWMLAGRKDVAFLSQFNRNMVNFSDDGVNFNAAYGYRWRHQFGRDQLDDVIMLMRRDPSTRQAVIQIWDTNDLQKKTKDKACNTQIVFDTRENLLNMTVFNRSNDIWWGAYGANAVHFSFLQEFVAHALGLPVGVYRQVSNNLHLYTELYNASKYLEKPPMPVDFDLYSNGKVAPRPIMSNTDHRLFLTECEMFCENPFNETLRYENSFFEKVARPMALISQARKSKAESGYKIAKHIKAEDWKHAVIAWIDRREEVKRSGEVKK